MEATRVTIAAFNDGDVDGFTEQFADDGEWLPFRSATEGAYVGPDGVRAWFRETLELFEHNSAEVDSTEIHGEAVVSSGRLSLRGRGSGATVEMPVTWVFRLKDDKVAWARAYSDRAEAMAELDRGQI